MTTDTNDTATHSPTMDYQAQGLFIATHEMEHLRRYLSASIDTLSHNEHLHSRAKLYAMRHLIALDNHIKQTINKLKESQT